MAGVLGLLMTTLIFHWAYPDYVDIAGVKGVPFLGAGGAGYYARRFSRATSRQTVEQVSRLSGFSRSSMAQVKASERPSGPDRVAKD